METIVRISMAVELNQELVDAVAESFRRRAQGTSESLLKAALIKKADCAEQWDIEGHDLAAFLAMTAGFGSVDGGEGYPVIAGNFELPVLLSPPANQRRKLNFDES